MWDREVDYRDVHCARFNWIDFDSHFLIEGNRGGIMVRGATSTIPTCSSQLNSVLLFSIGSPIMTPGYCQAWTLKKQVLRGAKDAQKTVSTY